MTRTTNKTALVGALLLLWILALVQPAQAQSFIHPGLLHTDADFARMQANYLNEPWVGSWNRLIANPHSQTTWNPNPQATVCRGAGCSGMGLAQNYMTMANDLHAAYQSALRYKITGDTAYANQSIRIMNAWSSTMTTLTGDADRFLAAGIYGYQWCQAAEMMRDYSGWAAADFTAFKNLMLNVFYPLQHSFLFDHNGACIENYWANWDLCNIAGMAAIGVLCDDRAIYNEALTYFKTGAGQGSIYHSVPFIYPGSPTLGQGQEEGRDQGHSGFDVSLWGVVCQQFYNQSDDMFAWNNYSILAACEYFAQYNINSNNTVPFTTFRWGNGTTCAQMAQTAVSTASRGNQRPSWDLIYNHYSVRLGFNAPSTAAYAALMRPDGGGGNYGSTSGGYDQLGFTTLTCTLGTTPPSPPQPPSPPPANSLVNWWKFDETSGTTAVDSVGGQTGDLAPGATWTAAGKIGGALSLNGSQIKHITNYVVLPAGIVSTLNDFSIATWVYVNANATWARLFDFGCGRDIYMFLAPSSGSTIRYSITTSGGAGEQRIESTAALAVGAWHHVAVTLSGTVGILYVDGTQVGQNTAMTLKPSSLGITTANCIGKSQYTGDPNLNGNVDDFRIYNYGLSAAEIATLAAGLPPPPAAPTGLTATAASSSQIALSWTDNSTNEDLFEIWRADSITWTYEYLTQVGPDTMTYSDTGLSADTTYFYIIWAYNAAGYSAGSNEASATTFP